VPGAISPTFHEQEKHRQSSSDDAILSGLPPELQEGFARAEDRRSKARPIAANPRLSKRLTCARKQNKAIKRMSAVQD